MRGQLHSAPRAPLDPTSFDTLEREEYLHIQRVIRRYMTTIESDLKRMSEVKSFGVDDPLLASRLNGLMHVVGDDMRGIVVCLHSVLCNVPINIKRKAFDNIHWDGNVYQLLIKHWAEPVVLCADFHLLKAMAMYQIGDMLSSLAQHSRADTYLIMAQRLVEKALGSLMANIGAEPNNPVAQFWRYECLIARIHLSLAALSLARAQTSPIELAARSFRQTAKSHYSQAMDHFLVGIKMYPSNTFPENGKQSFKELECNFFAEKIAEYASCRFEHLIDTSTWTAHTATLFSFAIRSAKHQCYRAHYLYRIAQLHLNHAMIFFQHPEAVVKAFPEKNHHFYSLQDQAVAAMVYAQQSIKEARAAGSSRPQHLSLIIECHLILAACVTSAPLNVWYRQQALDLTQLLATQFPNHVPNKELLRVAHSIAPRDT